MSACCCGAVGVGGGGGGLKWGKEGGGEEGRTVDELGVVEVESGAETNMRVMNKRSLRSLMLWSNH